MRIHSSMHTHSSGMIQGYIPGSEGFGMRDFGLAYLLLPELWFKGSSDALSWFEAHGLQRRVRVRAQG